MRAVGVGIEISARFASSLLTIPKSARVNERVTDTRGTPGRSRTLIYSQQNLHGAFSTIYMVEGDDGRTGAARAPVRFRCDVVLRRDTTQHFDPY
jgi:hypothetical protein